MSLADDVNLDEFVMTKDDLSGADIKAICTESGLLVSDWIIVRHGHSFADSIGLAGASRKKDEDYAGYLNFLNALSSAHVARKRPTVCWSCRIFQADFRKAKEKVMHKKKEGVPEGLYLWGACKVER